MSDKFRMNIDIDKQKLKEIQNLMEAGGITTYKDLFENALTITRWLMRQRKNGKAVGALSENDQFTELDMPILENAATSKIDI